MPVQDGAAIAFAMAGAAASQAAEAPKPLSSARRDETKRPSMVRFLRIRPFQNTPA